MGRCRGTRNTCTRRDRVSACSRGPACRRRRWRSCRAPSPGASDRRPRGRPAPTRGMERDRVGEPARHGLVAHRVDLELERVARPLPRPGRVADVRGLVVRDRDSLGAHDPERRRDDVRARRRRIARGGRRGCRRRIADGLDVDPIPAAADAVAAELEAELPLDVGRDDGVRQQLRRPEPAQGLRARPRGAPPRARRLTNPSLVQAASKTSSSSASLMTCPRA